MIKIVDSTYKRLAIVKQVVTANRFEEINGENTLNFTAIYDEKAASYLNENNLIELDDDYFDIVYYQKMQNEDGTLTIQVQTEHISYRLNNKEYNMDTFAATGTPAAVLEAILAGTPFTVGTVEFTNLVTYSIQEAKSRRLMLMEFIALLGGEADFDKFIINIVQHRGSIERKLLAKGKNIKVISKIFNAREKDENGNPLVSYTCTPIQLPGNSFALGDEVLLIQKDLGIQEQLRIVSYGYNPYDNIEASIELANFISGLEDQIYKIQTTIVAKEKIYNGCKIGPEEGFVATRSDFKARAIMNATEGIKIQKGDGQGNWTDALYLDTNGNGTFSGFILASQIIGGSILIGGQDIETAKFSVTSDGSLKAVNATVKDTLFLAGSEAGTTVNQAIKFGVDESPYLDPATINYVQGGGIASTSLNINSPGNMSLNASGAISIGDMSVDGNDVFIGAYTALNVNRIKGFSDWDIIYFGDDNCRIDVTGGTMRIKNANGAYLALTDTTLTFYEADGTAHVIV